MPANKSYEIPGFGLSFVFGFVLLSTIHFAWRLLTSVDLGPRWYLYAVLTGTGLLGTYVAFLRPRRIGLVVIPAHIGILFGYFAFVEWGYRTESELALIVVSWGVLVVLTLLNADYFAPSDCDG